MLWKAKQRGVSFNRLLTFGHQTLTLYREEVDLLRREYHPLRTPLDSYHLGDYADEFLRGLGASSITVIDASPYEGADTIHDMNTSIPQVWHGQYDVVIDCGSLEHIFNVPIALANLANMLKVGGTIFISTPANNLMGHGFYQFSPELMFRVFSEANGFALHKMWIYEARYPSVELTKNHTVYEVVDPEKVKSRVGLVSRKPVMMMIEATKICEAQMFATPPIQSDYAAMWKSEDRPRTHGTASRLLQMFPLRIRNTILGHYERRLFSLGNETFYRRHRWH